MDPSPSGLDGQFPALVHVNKPVGHQMDVQAVVFVQLKHPQSTEIGPSSLDRSQQVIPPFSGVLDVQNLLEGERPHVKPAFRQSFG